MESYSRTILDIIADTNKNDFHPDANLLSLVKRLSSLSWVVSFNHTLRENNECAYYLTYFGAHNVYFLKI